MHDHPGFLGHLNLYHPVWQLDLKVECAPWWPHRVLRATEGCVGFAGGAWQPFLRLEFGQWPGWSSSQLKRTSMASSWVISVEMRWICWNFWEKTTITSIRQESDTQDGLMMFDDFFHMCRIRNVLWPACYIPLANLVPPLSPKDAKVAGFLPIDWDHDGAMDLIIGAWGLSHLKYFQAGWCFLDERAIHMQFTKSLSVYRIY